VTPVPCLLLAFKFNKQCQMTKLDRFQVKWLKEEFWLACQFFTWIQLDAYSLTILDRAYNLVRLPVRSWTNSGCATLGEKIKWRHFGSAQRVTICPQSLESLFSSVNVMVIDVSSRHSCIIQIWSYTVKRLSRPYLMTFRPGKIGIQATVICPAVKWLNVWNVRSQEVLHLEGWMLYI
jgi:hypothetical protein